FQSTNDSIPSMSDDEDSVHERRSSRRRESKGQEKRKSALELFKEARKSGKAHKPADNTVQNVYDEVDEDEYNDIVNQRQRDDFVVDDDGAGYVDHGADFFDDDEEDPGERRRKQKKDKENKPKKGAINSFFSAANSMIKSKAKDDNDIKLEDDDDDLNNLLNEADNVEMETPSRNPFARSEARAPSPDRIMTRAIPRSRLSVPLSASSPRPAPVAAAAAAKTVPVKRPATMSVTPPPVAEKRQKHKEESFDDDFDTGFDVDMDDVGMTNNDERMEESAAPAPVKVESKPVVKMEQPRVEQETMINDWSVEQKDPTPSVVSIAQGSESFYQERDGRQCLRVFWLDAYEDDRKHPGVVYLFGRVFTSAGRSSSICIVVKNIRRQLFFLPRVQEDGTPYPMLDVYNEASKRRFINDGTVPEPAEDVEVIEVQYFEGKNSRIAPAYEGKSFTRVYNATTTSMERLLVECRMKGPGWINVANCAPATSKVSWCTYEFVLDMADDMSGVERPKNIVFDTATMDAAPPLRLMCLNVVTALNAKKEPEILALSYLVNTSASIEGPSTDMKYYRNKAFICEPPTGVALPFDLQRKLDERGLREDRVKIVKTEKALLAQFLNLLSSEEKELEPDAYVGHDLQATIALLMAKCEKHKIGAWSRLSRLRRSTAAKQLGHSKAAIWEATAGRLMFDSRAAAMELFPSRQYDLTELCRTLLNKDRTEVAPHEVIAKYCGSSAGIINLLSESWQECYRPLCILEQIQAIPLFRGITNICGGVMSRTLLGGRAERNELLLLHAFHRPERARSSSQTEDDVEEKGGEEKAGEPAKTGGAQYSGGLVLEPKKGLYDTLVLLLDFNSLYPSIIQQFNICFTTIRHDKNGDELPEEPKGVSAKGILPTEIENLVSQRFSVKALMKNEKNPEKYKQYDIRQKALKLTANSMYGCLGFAQSRFYAKPLAALVTAKGREILMETKTSVERLAYEVIYGDTDSIMVNTGDLDQERAKKIAAEITKMVNQRYRQIELEHEGTFRRMLLLKKKKYAALIMPPRPGMAPKKELKGLDIVRRDWSMLAKKIGSDVVDVMLDPSLSREELVEQIDKLLTTLREDLDAGIVSVDMFSIFKSLTRDPSKYENVQQQPHAAVAKRMNESGQKAYKQGDIVEYAICTDGTTASATQRAYHKQEMKAREDLQIDFQYYLSQQVHPVVSRLTAPIEELDAVRVAELLGLDGAHYRSKASSAAADNDSAWQETFDHCEGIKITCPSCEHLNEIREMFMGEGMDRRGALDCCEKCEAPFYRAAAAVYNQFSRQLSSLVEKQQLAAYVCDDVVCAHEMRSLPLRVTRDGLECPKCRTNFMHKEYTAKTLFEQQTFFDRLLDFFTAVKAIKNKDQRTTIEFRPNFKAVEALYHDLKRLNDSYMTKNSYNIVDLCFVFGPMMSK
ncbi:pola-1, partial [Pristionchus pacificus]